MDNVESRPTPWKLESPRLQIAIGKIYVVRAVVFRSEEAATDQISHIEVYCDYHLWLACPWNGLIGDPIDVVPAHLHRGAEIALNDWILWSRLLF
jgi:hypothetical protein